MKSEFFRRMITCALLFTGSAWMMSQLAGCNTIEDAGEDVEAVGEGVSDTAEDTNFYDDDVDDDFDDDMD